VYEGSGSVQKYAIRRVLHALHALRKARKEITALRRAVHGVRWNGPDQSHFRPRIRLAGHDFSSR
jgi:hypothetical protein